MNSSTALLKAMIARADYLDVIERAALLKILPILEAAHDSVLGKIAKTRGKYTAEWLAEMAADLQEIYYAATAKAYGSIRGDLEKLAQAEGAWIDGEIGQAAAGISFTAPAPSLLWAAVEALPASNGATLEQLFQALSDNSRSAAYEAISAGMIEGETVDQLAARLRGEVVKKAIWKNIDGKRTYIPGIYHGGALEDVTTRQATMLARTAVMHVSNAARDQFYKANEDIIKGYQRVETLDLRTCIVCGEADGRVYKIDAVRPSLPAHPGCLPGDTLISSGSRISAVSKRKYHGDMFVIRTSSGKQISATPNHPILTDAGFVSAENLNLGDNLICDSGIDRVSLVDENKNYIEARFEELFCSILKSSKMPPVSVPISSEDFHGDGLDDEIAVIATNRKLLDERNSSLKKKESKFIFITRGRTDSSLKSCLCSLLNFLFRLLSSCRRNVRSMRPCKSLLLGRIFYPLNLLLSMITKLNSILFKRANYISSTGPEPGCNSGSSNAGIVECKDFIDAGPDSRESPRWIGHSAATDCSVNGIPGYAKLARHIIDGLSGPVAIDYVVDIRKIDFSGHVYNLQSEDEYFIANGIITHNCRGVYVPVLKSWKELGVDGPDLPRSTRASMDGQVADSVTFADRLKSASRAQRIEMLGKARADLYDAGLPLDAMVEGGRALTLDEIAAKRKGRAA